MSLLTEVAALNVPRRERCSIAVLLETFDADDARDLRLLLADPDVPATLIARALSNRGHKVQGQTVRRHRKRDCSCPT